MRAVVSDGVAVDRLRATLAAGAVLLEPRAQAQGGWEWARASGREPFAWDAPRPLPSVKRFLFPPRETLLRWHGDVAREASATVVPLVLFGVHACDLAAIACLDRVFARDPAYRRRRGHALLVGVNCGRACPGGFCHEVDAGPFARAGFDLALTRLDDGRIVVECGSARGDAALAAAGVDANPLDAAARAAFAAAARAAAASFPARPFVAAAIARIDAGAGAAPIVDGEWQALGRACFACTGCTAVCPTCSCFTIVDEPDGAGGGERARHWDSCLLEGFQREASGHHPAPRAGDRVRRFWQHKLSREFVAALGRRGCVGCGRCDPTCLGEIGALGVLRALGSGP